MFQKGINGSHGKFLIHYVSSVLGITEVIVTAYYWFTFRIYLGNTIITMEDIKPNLQLSVGIKIILNHSKMIHY